MAMMVTIKTPSPFIPAFPMPRIKAAKKARNQFNQDNWNCTMLSAILCTICYFLGL
jgi:hypothetical protein